MSICFIVGHGKSANGGYDPGATAGNYHEFKIAREIARFAQEFYNDNYSEHCDLMNYDGNLYLTERIKKANAAKYDFIAEFHLNAGGGSGVEVYYSKGDKTGSAIASAVSKSIADTFAVRNRGAKTKLNAGGKDYFGIIRQTTMTALLIENLFIDTVSDLNLLKDTAGQKKCGIAIATAIGAARGASKAKKPASGSTATKPAQSSSKKTVDQIAQEVVAGKWGNGQDRINRLTAAGYDAEAVQAKVNTLMGAGQTKKTYKKGDAIVLNNSPLYASSSIAKYANKKTGTFYIYDGILANGRMRITNSKANVGRTPLSHYVTGWVNV